jgi:hypothetical protein
VEINNILDCAEILEIPSFSLLNLYQLLSPG